MATDKQISLEDVRRDPSLLDQFINQHPSKSDKKRFDVLLSEDYLGLGT